MSQFLNPNLTDFVSKLNTKYPLFGLRDSNSKATPCNPPLEDTFLVVELLPFSLQKSEKLADILSRKKISGKNFFGTIRHRSDRTGTDRMERAQIRRNRSVRNPPLCYGVLVSILSTDRTDRAQLNKSRTKRKFPKERKTNISKKRKTHISKKRKI